MSVIRHNVSAKFPALILLAALALSGCSSEGKNIKLSCPQSALVRELSKVADYGSDTPDKKTLVAAAEMVGISSKCSWNSKGVELDIRLDMKAVRGPRLGGNRFSAPFFLSVLDENGKILSKETMTAEFIVDDGDKPAELRENLHVSVPLSHAPDGENYRLLAGFQMTREQLVAARKAEEARSKAGN